MFRLVCIAFAGVITGLSFLTPFWFLSFIGVAFLLLQQPSERTGATIDTLLFAGVVQGTAYFSMYFDAIPLPWVQGVSIFGHIGYVGAAWLYTTLLGTVPFGVWGVLLSNQNLRQIRLITLPAAWVLTEWTSAYFISLGTEGLFRPQALSTVGFLGNQLADVPLLLQFSKIGGISFLSFIVIFLSVVCARTFEKYGSSRQRFACSIGAGLLILAGSCIPIPNSPSGAPLSVSLITTYTPPVFSITPEERREEDAHISEEIRTTGADIVVLPEATEYVKRNRSVLEQNASSTALILDSESVREGRGRIRRGEYFDAGLGASLYTEKEYLVPFGEYMPRTAQLVGSLFAPRFFESARKDRVYIPGTSSLFRTKEGVAISWRMCNEVVSSELYRNDTLKGAHALFNSAAHSWYHESFRVERQILRAAKIRAAENHRYLALANSGAPSFVVDWYGQVVSHAAWNSTESLEVPVYTSNVVTPFTRIGSDVFFVPALILMWSLWFSRPSHSREA